MKRVLFTLFILLIISLSSERRYSGRSYSGYSRRSYPRRSYSGRSYSGFKYRKNNKFLAFNKFRNNPRTENIHNSGSYVGDKKNKIFKYLKIFNIF